jgi:hypothetical protein
VCGMHPTDYTLVECDSCVSDIRTARYVPSCVCVIWWAMVEFSLMCPPDWQHVFIISLLHFVQLAFASTQLPLVWVWPGCAAISGT